MTHSDDLGRPRAPGEGGADDPTGRMLLGAVFVLRVTLIVGICFTAYAIVILLLLGVRP